MGIFEKPRQENAEDSIKERIGAEKSLFEHARTGKGRIIAGFLLLSSLYICEGCAMNIGVQKINNFHGIAMSIGEQEIKDSMGIAMNIGSQKLENYNGVALSIGDQEIKKAGNLEETELTK
ncbi:MAG TPA: hypothetical protein P5232_04310 [Candidatus Moranbacteria bacterium]|nr:hypothetical protein [Candidatus Moranbacteria bacterium]